ncbi:hypothetical protein [Paramaledivibacter caminithermalis]|jgi:uncharacterized phage infection (PIP) family protein YhgE|uniref:Uncharacterized protein n=1 Tax=Paramaledivibacter caminithermalis (strain DSM 15212 / CIP 107654 / DViRD3) TaxID=1121301 RepID=A0A1M6TWN3_PARC5|nr:hypothetical protein [Paramaledivibacter caminithermalis]SHK61300.1 hypothetical protein SAMN02745912_03815 [Paramaledivibacter caminithermalis DSM 15212]
MEKILNQILAELKELNKSQEELLMSHEELKKNQEELMIGYKELKVSQEEIVERLDRIENKFDVINEQIADLTEFKTETIQGLKDIKDTLKFIVLGCKTSTLVVEAVSPIHFRGSMPLK